MVCGRAAFASASLRGRERADRRARALSWCSCSCAALLTRDLFVCLYLCLTLLVLVSVRNCAHARDTQSSSLCTVCCACAGACACACVVCECESAQVRSCARVSACRLVGWAKGAAEGRAAGRGVCFRAPPTSGLVRRGRRLRAREVCPLRLSQPTSGLVRRGRRRGAQLDGEFALAADFGWRGAQLDREFAFYASRRRLRTWLDCGGGACSWTGNFHCMLLAADFGAGPEGAAGRCSAFAWSSLFYLSLTGLCYAHSLVPRLPTPSKTVDQTLLPRWDGQRRRLYCVS